VQAIRQPTTSLSLSHVRMHINLASSLLSPAASAAARCLSGAAVLACLLQRRCSLLPSLFSSPQLLPLPLPPPRPAPASSTVRGANIGGANRWSGGRRSKSRRKSMEAVDVEQRKGAGAGGRSGSPPDSCAAAALFPSPLASLPNFPTRAPLPSRFPRARSQFFVAAASSDD
jgi:hypothetical protein